ncbi:unnamed protein product [Prorocentrum cordatum]|uniref:Uncharacterized protein n=1 Tax=Prorocentrum cordatum TaxID=2364126 RepID=A0ABN9S6J1_9DINO|nr:unnamed protein product [Polarella glacialis]
MPAPGVGDGVGRLGSRALLEKHPWPRVCPPGFSGWPMDGHPESPGRIGQGRFWRLVLLGLLGASFDKACPRTAPSTASSPRESARRVCAGAGRRQRRRAPRPGLLAARPVGAKAPGQQNGSFAKTVSRTGLFRGVAAPEEGQSAPALGAT